MFDKKKIKAVRVMLGFTDDLRVALPITAHNSVVKLVEDNAYNLLGPDKYVSKYKDSYISDFISIVIRGNER